MGEAMDTGTIVEQAGEEARRGDEEWADGGDGSDASSDVEAARLADVYADPGQVVEESLS